VVNNESARKITGLNLMPHIKGGTQIEGELPDFLGFEDSRCSFVVFNTM
jgi:hypothetical protein